MTKEVHGVLPDGLTRRFPTTCNFSSTYGSTIGTVHISYHHYITTSRLLKLFTASRGEGHTIGPLQMAVQTIFNFSKSR
jgi:hypothetical protein